MKALVLNQDSQTTRMAFQKKQLKSLSIEFQRVPAYEIKGGEDTAFKKYHDKWCRPLTIPEVSCFFGHKRAWEIILDTNQPMLILEDDAWVDESTKSALEAFNQLEGIDYITLEVSRANRKKLVSKTAKAISSGITLLRLYQGRSGAAGYVLWPSGARKLLDKFDENKIGIVDKFMNACYNLKAYQLEPCLVIQLDQCPFHGITPPIKVNTTIPAEKNKVVNPINKTRYLLRRMLSEAKVGINLLKHSFNTERRSIMLSNNFKKRSQQ